MSAAALLKAAKHIIAEAAKKKAVSTLKRKKNPAPRIGTKKPTRASQVTGKPPTKRLVKRRKSNKVEGYFPNPAEVVEAHAGGVTHPKTKYPFEVQAKAMKKWHSMGLFEKESDAIDMANFYAKKHKRTVRVIRR